MRRINRRTELAHPQCPGCKAPLDADVLFCPDCGISLKGDKPLFFPLSSVILVLLVVLFLAALAIWPVSSAVVPVAGVLLLLFYYVADALYGRAVRSKQPVIPGWQSQEKFLQNKLAEIQARQERIEDAEWQLKHGPDASDLAG